MPKRLEQLTKEATYILDVEGAKPREALQRLREVVPQDSKSREEWRIKARVASVMGSCPRTHASFRSGDIFIADACMCLSCLRVFGLGLRHWIEYITIVHGNVARGFPPELCDVLGWANTFRCLGTFSNYLRFLRGACHAVGVEAPPTGHPALTRAMQAIAKRQAFTQR